MNKPRRGTFRWYAPYIVMALLWAILVYQNAAYADSVRLHMLSKHYDSVGFDWNEVNPGLGYGHDTFTNMRTIGGFFRNSVYDTSLYAGFELHTNTTIEVGLAFGAMTGYEKDVNPALAAHIQYGPVRVGLQPVMWFGEVKGAATTLTLVFGD